TGQAILETDHLTLLGHANSPGHRSRRLRQQRHARWRAATTDRTTTTMEQRQRNTALPEQRRQFFLRLELRPGGTEKAGILGGIRITNHHFLAVRYLFAIPVDLQQRRHG